MNLVFYLMIGVMLAVMQDVPAKDKKEQTKMMYVMLFVLIGWPVYLVYKTLVKLVLKR